MANAMQDPEQKRDHQLLLGILQPAVALITGLAWPIVAIIFFALLSSKAPDILRELRAGGNIEASIGSAGFTIKVYEKVQKGLIEQATAPQVPGGAPKIVSFGDLAEISRVSAFAAATPSPAIQPNSTAR